MSARSKLFYDLLEKIDDAIASLKRDGKMAEAGAKEAERAKLLKKFKADQENMSLNEVLSEGAETGPKRSPKHQYDDAAGPQEAAGPQRKPEHQYDQAAGPGADGTAGPTKDPFHQYTDSAGPQEVAGPHVSDPVKSRYSQEDLTAPLPSPILGESPNPASLLDTMNKKSKAGKVVKGAIVGGGVVAGTSMYMDGKGKIPAGSPQAAPEWHPPMAPKGDVEATEVTPADGTLPSTAPKTLGEALGSKTSGKGKSSASASSESSSSVSGSGPSELDDAASLLGRLKKADRKEFDHSSYDTERKGARDTYDKDSERNDWLSLADRMGRAMVQIGAGAQGLKENVDLSNIKGEPLDVSRFDKRAADKRSTAEQDIARREASAKEALAESNRRAEKETDAENDILSKDWMEKWKAYRDSQKQEKQISADKEIAGIRAAATTEAATTRANAPSRSGGLTPEERKAKDLRTQELATINQSIAELKKRQQAEALLSTALTKAGGAKLLGKKKDMEAALNEARKAAAAAGYTVAEVDSLFTPSEGSNWYGKTVLEYDIGVLKNHAKKRSEQNVKRLEQLQQELQKRSTVQLGLDDDTSGGVKTPTPEQVKAYAEKYKMSEEKALKIMTKQLNEQN